ELMKAMNDKNTDAFLAFCRQMIIDEKLVIGRDRTDSTQIGRLSPARYQTQITQLEDLDILPKGALTVDQVMTTDYLPEQKSRILTKRRRPAKFTNPTASFPPAFSAISPPPRLCVKTPTRFHSSAAASATSAPLR